MTSQKETMSDILFYQTEDGSTRIDVRLQDETVWLTQAQMAELFQKDKRTISEHIQNIFTEGELDQNSVVRNFRITASDGKEYLTNTYSLDVVISVGYRVKSHRGTQFRIWATQLQTSLRGLRLMQAEAIQSQHQKRTGLLRASALAMTASLPFSRHLYLRKSHTMATGHR
jgi:hypothetical protein